MKISDEIRKWCASHEGAITYKGDFEKLRALADRIDSEIVELPKDADGEPIHVCDLVYLDDGRRACVTEIDIKDGCVAIDCWDGSRHVAYHPSGITRKQPDSLESIAHDIETSKGIVLISDNTLDGWAYRIRKLAEKEDKR